MRLAGLLASDQIGGCGMASFRILGPIEAAVGERFLSIGGRRQLQLFAFLVLRANQAVSNDRLTDVVWGPTRSRSDNRLQMAITRLRKALEPLNDGTGSRLRTVGGGYMLSVAPGELDAEVFAQRVQEGRQVLDARSRRASELLTNALALWRGPPLAEVAFEDFAQAEIRRLEELRLEALESRIDANLQLGAHVRVIGELQALLAEHPVRERLASQLMLAMYHWGAKPTRSRSTSTPAPASPNSSGSSPGRHSRPYSLRSLSTRRRCRRADHPAGGLASIRAWHGVRRSSRLRTHRLPAGFHCWQRTRCHAQGRGSAAGR